MEIGSVRVERMCSREKIDAKDVTYGDLLLIDKVVFQVINIQCMGSMHRTFYILTLKNGTDNSIIVKRYGDTRCMSKHDGLCDCRKVTRLLTSSFFDTSLFTHLST